MLFNSWTFLVFLAIVLGAYYRLSFRGQNRLLLGASAIFYAAWDPRYLVLLIGTTSADFLLGRAIYESQDGAKKKQYLRISLLVNLAVLGFFKYFGFFVDSAIALLARVGVSVPRVVLDVALPVGISFYTFHAMSYAVDIYRGRAKPAESYATYMLFVLYFPQLVAGPIARAHALLPQVERPRKVAKDQVLWGVWLILWGYFKKVVVGDHLAVVADQAFEDGASVSGLECLLGIYAFAYQIYCDFSGYTDIARGLGKVMGFELAENFRVPYLAKNPVEFWQRWHISLSTWLRDYLYIPMGGNRGSTYETCRNLMVTMLIGGLWHGAAWTFVVWGAYHGALLVGHRLLVGKSTVDDERPLVVFASRVAMFHAACFGWLLFRANHLGQVGTMVHRMAEGLPLTMRAAQWCFPLLLFVPIVWSIDLWIGTEAFPWARPGWKQGLGALVVSVLLLAVLWLAPGASKPFIYFQF